MVHPSILIRPTIYQVNINISSVIEFCYCDFGCVVSSSVIQNQINFRLARINPQSHGNMKMVHPSILIRPTIYQVNINVSSVIEISYCNFGWVVSSSVSQNQLNFRLVRNLQSHGSLKMVHPSLLIRPTIYLVNINRVLLLQFRFFSFFLSTDVKRLSLIILVYRIGDI